MLFISACDSDSLRPGEDDVDNPADGVTIEFTMLTRNAETGHTSRTLIPPTGTPQIGYRAENFLDLDNITFLLFDSEQKLLRKLTAEVSVVNDGSGPYVKYSVRTFIHDNYFLKATSEYITFTFLAIGNQAGLSPENFHYHIGQSLEDIFNQAKVATFAFPVSNNSQGTWIPTIAPVEGLQAAHIPMSGMQTFTVKVASLRSSSPDRPYQLSSGTSPKYLNMLRAVAKIEIIDKIFPGIAEDADFTIEKAELVGHTTRGSMLPDFSQWQTDLETQYVTAPSVPASAQYIGAEPTSGFNLPDSDIDAVQTFFIDTEATALRNDGCKVLSCYLTEYDPESRGIVPPMWIRLTLKSLSTGKISTRRLEVASYTGGIAGEPLQILRNNIYRYQITGANDISLDIQPFANLELTFGFGLMRDSRGDLMVLPDKDGNYPDYFIEFLKTHSFPCVIDEDGNLTTEPIKLEKGDYYAIVVGENEDMTHAEIWIKDSEEYHVLSNFGSVVESQYCGARLVESFYGNNESERFLKDIYGYRRVHHFTNHNSIVRDPVDDGLLFCYIIDFQQEDEIRRYYEVESWDESTLTGWIILKSEDGTETGFQQITSEGTLGETRPLN